MWGFDAFCWKGHHSWLEHYTPVRPRAPNAPRKLSPRGQVGRPSGRQDSNLRPLVPQTSPYFLIPFEFDLECFRREMVGMTTRARVLESIGIASTSGGRATAACGFSPPRNNLSTLRVRPALVTTSAFRLRSPP